MKEIKIKVDFSHGKICPQIEYGPYDSSDLIARAIVSVLDYNMLQKLYEEKRLEVVEENQDKGIFIYKYN